MSLSRRTRILSLTLLSAFLLLNAVVAFHAWRFTHFTDSTTGRTDPRKLSFSGKLQALFLGASNPRPQTRTFPSVPYQTIRLQGSRQIECWIIRAPEARGSVILFHGYGGEKSSLLSQAEAFRRLGYHTMLVDFMGAGGSEGNSTTIGYREAEQVTASYRYLQGQGERTIFLYGVSMGAAAIMRAIHTDGLRPQAIIIECPFATMSDAVAARFRMMGIPSFPLAQLLLFWGGVENGFWAFSHNPASYARSVTVPTLMMYGAKDDRVSRKETDAVFANLRGEKELRIFPEAGHENYLNRYRHKWVMNVRSFLNAHP